MIKANELRIGNIVDWYFGEENSEGEMMGYTERVKIDLHFLEQLSNDPNAARPTDINEELLAKCGFKKFSPLEYFKKIPLTIRLDNSENSMGHDIYFGEEMRIICIVQFVHQLQNLYFALNGEELNIEL